MTIVSDHPEFTSEQLAEIRLLAAEKWETLHRAKNESGSQAVRDTLTQRLHRLETIANQAGGAG